MAPHSNDGYPHSRVTGAFERRVARALEPLLDAEERVVVAVSGGPDSTAALVAVTRVLGPERVIAAHFDHRLRSRGEAADELAAVREVAEALGVQVIAGRGARVPAQASEEAAREARYRWLASALRRSDSKVCVTGHTLDDQAETVLLRLTRGTGAAGMAGMAPLAPWPLPRRGAKQLRIVRPLLEITRVEVERYLGRLGITAAYDASNDTLVYARNRVRQRVLPELRALNPRVAEQIARFAALQRADDHALEAWARTELARLSHPSERGIEIDRRELRALPAAVRARCVRLAAEQVGLRLDGAQLTAIEGVLGRSGGRVDLGGGRARTAPGVLVIEAGGA